MRELGSFFGNLNWFPSFDTDFVLDRQDSAVESWCWATLSVEVARAGAGQSHVYSVSSDPSWYFDGVISAKITYFLCQFKWYLLNYLI